MSNYEETYNKAISIPEEVENKKESTNRQNYEETYNKSISI